jgi:DNA-binding CsgD family transcriptional regulator
VGTGVPGSLIGRTSELDDLRSFLDRVARGTGGIVIIEGEAGIGKSRLLAAAIENAADVGFTVASGQAYEVERDRPFGALVDALNLRAGQGDHRDEIVALLKRGSPDGAANDRNASDVRFLIVERIVDLIENDSSSAPLLIGVEDLHWADPSTLLALHRLSAGIDHLPACVVCTVRPTPRTADLQSLFDTLFERGASTIALQPLVPNAVAELVAATVGAAPGTCLLEKISGAAGNPLFVTELLAALAQENLIDIADGVAEVRESSLPPSLTLTILRRIAFLSSAALETLRIASVLGVAFSLGDLGVVMKRSAADLVAAIEEAKAARLLGEAGDRLAFRHDLVRDAIYQDMLEPVRKALHLQTARALAAAGAPAPQVAIHMGLGADPGDVEASQWLQRAARETAAQAPLVSVELLERAVELAGSDVRSGEDLSIALAWALLNAGRPIEAERVVRPLSTSRRRAIRHAARRALSLALNFQGHWERAAQMLDDALSDSSLSPLERTRLMGERAYALLMFQPEYAAAAAATAIQAADEHSDPLTSYLGQLILTWLRFFDGRLGEALAAADGAIEHAAAVRGEDPRAAEAEQLRCWILAFSDRTDDAEAAFDMYRREYEDGSWVKWARYYTGISYLYFNLGRWDDAVAEAQTGVAACDEAGLHNDAAICRQLLCYIAVRRDDLSAAESHLRQIPGAMWTRAVVAEAKHDTAQLEEILTSYRPSLESPRPWHMPLAAVVARDWVRLYRAAGDIDGARAMTEVIEEAAQRGPIASVEGTALGCRGLAEDNVELLLASAERLRRSPRLHARAQACEDAGVAVAAGGAVDEAATLLLEAIELYESMGALRDAARVDAALRALGVRRGRRGPRRRPRFGWESLTETEQRIVALVAEGQTYREIGQRLFISRRTVETHVAHVFAKLGMSSRRELAEMVRRRGV